MSTLAEAVESLEDSPWYCSECSRVLLPEEREGGICGPCDAALWAEFKDIDAKADE